jgi:hypothetical protein
MPAVDDEGNGSPFVALEALAAGVRKCQGKRMGASSPARRLRLQVATLDGLWRYARIGLESRRSIQKLIRQSQTDSALMDMPAARIIPRMKGTSSHSHWSVL